MSFLPPIRECIDRFARALFVLDRVSAASAAAGLSAKQLQLQSTQVVENELVPCLVDLKTRLDASPGRCPIRCSNASGAFSLDEDELIALGLGDWEAALERAFSNDRAAMLTALSAASAVAVSSTASSSASASVVDDHRVLAALKIAVLGATRAGSGTAAPEGTLAKASRRHQRRVESLLQLQQQVSASILDMQSHLRTVETVVLLVLLASRRDGGGATSVAVEQLCSTALLALVPTRVLPPAERARLVRSLPWNARRQRELLERISSRHVAVLQRFARRVVALRRCRLVREQREQKLRPLFAAIAARFAAAPSSGAAAAVSQMQRAVMRGVVETELRGAELQDYLDNEEPRFREEWRRYEQGLRHHFMHEAELDPAVWKQVAVRDEASGEMQPRFLDLRSGKLQQEHPMKDKIFQVKQRQWLAATRTRSATVARATSDLDALQRSAAAGGALAGELAALRIAIVKRS